MNIDGIDFGFVCTKNTPIYAYFNTDVGDNLTIELWKEIEDATVKNNPFYKNEYIVCTVNRVPNSYWRLSKRYDNVHIVKLESLFAAYMEDYNKREHPRFVPSFVRRRGEK